MSSPKTVSRIRSIPGQSRKQKESTYQGSCFTPKKQIPRTPPDKKRQLVWSPPPNSDKEINHENISPSVDNTHTTSLCSNKHKSNTKSSSTCTPLHKGTTKVPVYKLDEGHSRKVQDDCFTPSRSLKRSPRSIRPSPQSNTKEVDNRVLSDANGASPDFSRASRTRVKHSPLRQLNMTEDPINKEINRSNPIKNAKSLSKATKKVPIKKPSSSLLCNVARQGISVPNPIKETGGDGIVDIAPPATHWELPRTPVLTTRVHHVQLIPAQKRSQSPVRVKTPTHPLSVSKQAAPTPLPKKRLLLSEEECQNQVSPPISTLKDSNILPGLACTEDDMAFLQRMKNVKQYKQLKDQINQLEKAQKATSQQKEQLQHETLKIDRDLEDMKTKYNQTVSSIHVLLSDPSAVLDGSNAALDVNVDTHTLTDTHVTKLRKLNQLASAETEKTNKQLRTKLMDIDKAKQKLQDEIREHEEPAAQERRQLQLKLQAAKEKKEEWECKVQQVTMHQESTKDQIASLELEISKLRFDIGPTEKMTAPAQKSKDCALQKKQKAEERLKRIIRRCELYVERHQMLKEMGVYKTKN